MTSAKPSSSSQHYEVLRKYLLNLPLNPEIVDEVLQYFVVKHYCRGEYFYMKD